MRSLSDYRRVRQVSIDQLATLDPEDCVVQSMPDVSPPKWHVAHTSWFFETFVLEPFSADYAPFSPEYKFLFNSYYEAVGARQPRPERGHLSRPTLREVLAYRAHVDDAIARVFSRLPAEALGLVELGLHHEQQHQELLVMDVKHNFSKNPLAPAYRPEPIEPFLDAGPLGFHAFEPNLVRLGADGASGFTFDNERPSHRRFLEPFLLADRLVTNAEYRAFVEDRGYERPELWLSDGLSWVRQNAIEAPLYWRTSSARPIEFTAHGEVPLDPHAPVCHVSGFEAAAYAAWAGARLPTEFEWELVAKGHDADSARWLSEGPLHPSSPAPTATGMRQLFGDVWEWTRSAYEPYPGFRQEGGAVGEYNGKFMSGQWVLRGGCVATPRGHTRATYRNFFYPHQRWPFTGIRLAKDAR